MVAIRNYFDGGLLVSSVSSCLDAVRGTYITVGLCAQVHEIGLVHLIVGLSGAQLEIGRPRQS